MGTVFPGRMADHLKALQEELDRHEQKKAGKERYLGHRINRGFYLVIVVLVLIIVAILLAEQAAIRHLQDEQQRTLTENAYLQSELDHYRAAYQSALQDAQAFGKIYDITYANGTPESNETNASNATAPRLTVPQTESGPVTLPGTDAWDYYAKQGVINDSCIPTTKVVQTDGSTVDVVVIASGKEGTEWPRLMVVIDGAPVGSYTVNSTEQQVLKTSVIMPAGTHHLDILFLNGGQATSVSIPLVRIGDRTLENAVSVIDYGAGFGALDCVDTATGDTLSATGAMRFRIEKL